MLAYGETLLGWNGEGSWSPGHKTWYPGDMCLSPEAFLKGVDTEENNFGIKSALKLWLDLENKGGCWPPESHVNPNQGFDWVY